MQLYHKSLCLCGYLLHTYIAVVQKACVLLLAMLLVVLLLQNAAYTLSPVILVCLYLGLGQAGIN